MQIPKRTKDTDITQEVIRGKSFKKKVLDLGKTIGQAFVNESSGKSLSQRIAAAAVNERFNRIQIQSLIEETNTQAYLAKYGQLREFKERDVRFELAELGKVIDEMGDAAPPEVVNLNRVEGKEGEGEMKKVASFQPVEPELSTRIGEAFTKVASYQPESRMTASERKRLTIDKQSALFKIAQSLVLTERVHQNANEVFNTLIKEAAFEEEDIDGITKMASDISISLHNRGKLVKARMVNLKVNPSEKVASHLLGRFSLIDKQASGDHIKEIAVSGMDGIDSFGALKKVAMVVEQSNAALNKSK